MLPYCKRCLRDLPIISRLRCMSLHPVQVGVSAGKNCEAAVSTAKTCSAGSEALTLFYFAASDFRRRMIFANPRKGGVHYLGIRKVFCDVRLQHDDVASLSIVVAV